MKTKTCNWCGRRKPLDKFVKQAAAPDGRRKICKPCDNERKRALRTRHRGRPVEPRNGIHWVRIPTSRLKPLAETYLQENPTVYSFGCKAESLPRQIFKVVTEETEMVGWDFAEKLLINMNMEHMWHIPPHMGGLSDLYHLEDCAGTNGTAQPPATREPGRASGGGTFAPRQAAPSPSSRRGSTPLQRRAA